MELVGQALIDQLKEQTAISERRSEQLEAKIESLGQKMKSMKADGDLFLDFWQNYGTFIETVFGVAAVKWRCQVPEYSQIEGELDAAHLRWVEYEV